MLTLACGGGTPNAFVNKGTWLVKNSQKSAYVIYERPLSWIWMSLKDGLKYNNNFFRVK